MTAKKNKEKKVETLKTKRKHLVVKKKSGKKKTKKKMGPTPLRQPKLRKANANTIVTHKIFTPQQQPSTYKVQYYDKSQLKYTPFVLKDKSVPKFRLPTGVTPSVDYMCTLS